MTVIVLALIYGFGSVALAVIAVLFGL
jgi:hypothetical protein